MSTGNPYHDVAYPTAAMEQSHVDRLQCVATLLGMSPAPASSCRVLELGCGTGANIIPMAYFLPGSQFLGVDLAPSAVQRGRQSVKELALDNVDLRAMDLCEIGPDFGEFDYIIAAGVYSWVPAPVRERVLTICRERLAPQGVAYINYNALPGRYVRMMLRDMMIAHTKDCGTPAEQIKAARELLAKVNEAHLAPASWQVMIDQQIRVALTGDDGWFYHDDLSPENEAFYVRDFIAASDAHGLQYLGDAQPHVMFDTRDPLDWVEGGLVEREQYYDFLCLRQFRQTLLCHREVVLDRPVTAGRMDQFLFASPARASEGGFEGFNSVNITNPPQQVAAVAALLASYFPQPAPFEAFLQINADLKKLRDILLALVSSGFAEIYLNDLAPAAGVSSHPKASSLARWECAQGGIVTTAQHVLRKLDPTMRALINLLDGSHDLKSLATAFARVESAPPLATVKERLPNVLLEMARCGLLES